jgi:fermentation-respiration switch protein FrsA (DUF1100 family)
MANLLVLTLLGLVGAWFVRHYKSIPKPAWYQWTLIPITKLVFQPPRASYRSKDPGFFFIETKNTKQQICCYHIKTPGATKTIIFSHGNAEDIGQNIGWLEQMSNQIGVNILAYDYEGYGQSSGEPSEYGVQDDIIAVYEYLRDDLKLDPKSIVLFGRSVGGGPTVYLASQVKGQIGGVILLSAFTSAIGTTLNYRWSRYIPSWLVRDVFDNYSKLKDIDEKVPFLFIHGTADTIVPYSHSVDMYNFVKGLNRNAEMVSLNRNHNDVLSSYKTIYQAVQNFLSKLH